jgi:hypothetical protein
MTIDLSSLPAAEAMIDCGGETHRIGWKGGELLAADHDDLDSELALSALGGTSPACLKVVTAWRRHRHDHRLLSALTRGPGDTVSSPTHPLAGRPTANARWSRPRRGPNPAVVAGGAVGWTAIGGPGASTPPTSSRPPSGEDEVALLAGLGGAIPRRMAATVTCALLDADAISGTQPAPFRPALEASLFGRVRNTLASWRGQPGLNVELHVIEPGETPAAEKSDGGVRVRLPLTWVADVWGRGLGTVAERFTLSVLEAEPDRWVLETIGDDLRSRRQVIVSLN